MKHAPTRKLADAVFRGKDNVYRFKVYPLTATITDQPAVFIISRRITDRSGRGHQAAVCIGETESTFDEIKKHKKSKCVKERSSNVVCLLKEKERKSRLTVIEDLIAARSFGCVKNVYKTKIEPTSKTRNAKSTDRVKLPKNTSLNTRARSSGIIAKRAAATKTRTRVQGGVDSDRRQHRLSNQKRSVTGKAKGRTVGVSGARKKSAA